MGMFDFVAGQPRTPTWEEVQRRRALADALAGNVGAPQTFGQGLSAIGAALGNVIADRKANRMDGERASLADAAFEQALNSMPQDNSSLANALGQNFATPTSTVAPVEAAPQGYGIQPGVAPGAAAAFPASLVRTESGGDWTALNSEGYGGRLQFGASRLADAARAGVIPAGIDGAAFSRMPPEVQQRVENWHFSDIDQQAHRMGLDRYIGQTVGGVPITQDGIRAMAHLGGIGGAAKFLNSGGTVNPADSNGTSLAKYAQIHGGMANEPTQGGVAPLNIPAPPPINVSLIRAMNNPYMSPEQKQILSGIYQQQQAMQITPYQAAQLQMQQQQMAMQGQITPYQQATLDQQAAQTQWERERFGIEQNTAAQKAQADATRAASTDDIREYEFARQGGFTGSFADWQLAQKKAGAASTNVTVGGDGAPGLGKLSTDYGYVLDPVTGQPVIDPRTGLPTAAAVPGSPAALEAAKEAQAGVVKEGNKSVSTDVITGAAAKAREAAADRQLGGFGQGIAATLPWTDSAEVARQVEVLKSNAKVENLQAMRAASPTGGALGAVSDSENAMLAAKAGALDPSSPTFARDLDDYERTLLRIVHGPEAGDRIYNATRGKPKQRDTDDDLLKKYGG